MMLEGTELDLWREKREQDKMLDDYFGYDKKEVKDGADNGTGNS